MSEHISTPSLLRRQESTTLEAGINPKGRKIRMGLMDSRLRGSDALRILMCLFVFNALADNLYAQTVPPRPNIILIMADDMGWSDLGSYGAEIIQTPNIDELAAQGMRFTDFYNNARCWITRASLMSGRYHHRAGGGSINQSSMVVAEVLKSAGYNTSMAGKWHLNTPWPANRGFDDFYGTIIGCNGYFGPTLRCNGNDIKLYRNNDEIQITDPDFYITRTYTDMGISFIEEHMPKDEPMFLYMAYTAPHWPLHALPEDIDLYRGKFGERGWDDLRAARFENIQTLGLMDDRFDLPPRDGSVSSWADAPDKTELDLEMAVYAAQMHRLDIGIGRIMDKVKELGEWENTLFLFLSDNGAANEPAENWNSMEDQSGETGTNQSYRSYSKGWAHYSDTPFKGYKANVWEGGARTPLIAHWPAGIPKNVITNAPGHVVDIMPTILELAGAEYPETDGNDNIEPMDGSSLADVFAYGVRPTPPQIYLDHNGRAVRQGDFKAWASSNGSWQLYNLADDPFEQNNIAGSNAAKVTELAGLWDAFLASDVPTAADALDIVEGCLDSTAQNYDPAANRSDGSCIAAPVRHDGPAETLPGFRVIGHRLELFFSGGLHHVSVYSLQGKRILEKSVTVKQAVFDLQTGRGACQLLIKGAGATVSKKLVIF